MKTALIVDDEADICELIEITLQRMNINTYSALTIKQAKHLLHHHHFDLCITDMRLTDGNGLELVELIQKKFSTTPVAVISAHGNVELAVQALKLGAFDFISKPLDINQLRAIVNTSTRQVKPREQSTLTLIGHSANIEKTRCTIAKLARSQAPVYIHGESGSGKELAARMIHEQGPRANFPFIAVNCGAIPPELMESEFFGHQKGSFTNAFSDKDGLFMVASGGTLFLDEVADLPLHMQVKLLRSIQEKSIRPIGAAKELKIDCRILSATHKNLVEMVETGDFRQDLFYRINVIDLHIPPLRERQEDIPLMIEHILTKLLPQDETLILAKSALQKLNHYAFPGNVRELENILERAYTLSDNDILEAEDIQLPDHERLTLHAQEHQKPAHLSLEEFLEEIEVDTIQQTLEACQYNKTATAKKLGISFRALRYRLKKLNIN